MSDPPRDPYAVFLTSADVGVWRDCMESAVRRVPDAPRDSDGFRALEQALCITMYLRWLARQSGDLRAEEEGARRHQELRAILTANSPDPPTAASRICWGLVLCWIGYRKQAARLLDQGDATPVEHTLLTVEDHDVASLPVLRRLFEGPSRCTFLPAVNIYGCLLADVGALREARELLTYGDWDDSEPLLLDILGTVSERLGQWDEAYAAYSRSPWPVHRYRAAMAGAIAGRSAPEGDHVVLDEPMLRLMAQIEGEITQAEVARLMAFLNACLWRPVDDWVVRLELGKLGFRRRRYAEAEHYFRWAAKSAPEAVRLVIAGMRFTNLSWLTGKQLHSATEMTPEVLSVGQEVLKGTADPDEAALISTWMAGETGDLSLLPVSLDDWSPERRADAYRIVGDTCRAVDSWIEDLEQSYWHRSCTEFLIVLANAGFMRTASHLADVVLRESVDDFLPLWETARALQDLSPELPGLAADEDFGDLHGHYRRRLIELSQFDFKNAVRAHGLIARAGRQDLAEELRLRAVKHADGVSELLAVASLCREVGTEQARQEGLWCVSRALPEARERMERLEIARELFRYDQIRDAHEVLERERLLDGDARLSHGEMTAVLSCGRWLAPEELQHLTDQAVRGLNRDHGSGALGTFAAFYGNRLIDTVKAYDSVLARQIENRLDIGLSGFFSGAPWPGLTDQAWPMVRDRIDQALEDTAESGALWLTECLGSAYRDATFGVRLSVCGHLRRRLAEAHVEGDRATLSLLDEPQVEGEDIMYSIQDEERLYLKPYGAGAARTVQLCDLWRARLTAPDDSAEAAAVAGLDEFLAQEQHRRELWEEQRRAFHEPSLRRARRVAETLVDCLRGLLGPAELGHPHPVLRGLFEHVALDVEALAGETADLGEKARSRLQVPVRRAQGEERS